MQRNALISGDGIFRYTLTRYWTNDRHLKVVFCMLNPSVADSKIDDPTVRRCVEFAKSWGAGAIEIVNLFAHRSTDRRYLDILSVGPDNDYFILQAAKSNPPFSFAPSIVCAWGLLDKRFMVERADAVLKMIRDSGCMTWCLGRTKDGFPRHPLYLRRDTIPKIYE